MAEDTRNRTGRHTIDIPAEGRGGRAAQACAWILVTTGIMLELARVIYGVPGPGAGWQMAVLAGGLWDLLRAMISMVAKPEGLSLWPWMLVAAGLAALAVEKRAELARTAAARQREQGGNRYAE